VVFRLRCTTFSAAIRCSRCVTLPDKLLLLLLLLPAAMTRPSMPGSRWWSRAPAGAAASQLCAVRSRLPP